MPTTAPALVFHDSEEAFAGAIEDGDLSDDPTAPNFAGHYMYMGTEQDADPQHPDHLTDRDLFKHIDTRRYLRVPSYWTRTR